MSNRGAPWHAYPVDRLRGTPGIRCSAKLTHIISRFAAIPLAACLLAADSQSAYNASSDNAPIRKEFDPAAIQESYSNRIAACFNSTASTSIVTALDVCLEDADYVPCGLSTESCNNMLIASYDAILQLDLTHLANDKETLDVIKFSQSSWLVYKDAECALERDLAPYPEGGRATTRYSECELGLLMERTKKIHRIRHSYRER